MVEVLTIFCYACIFMVIAAPWIWLATWGFVLEKDRQDDNPF